MTATTLSTLAGAALSLLFSYVPGFQAFFSRLDGTHKRLVMLALLVVVSAAAYGLACAGVPLAGAPTAGQTTLAPLLRCDRPGLFELLQALVFAIMANQSTYQLTPRNHAIQKEEVAEIL